MLYPKQDVAFGRLITSQFIRDDHLRDIVQFFKEFAKESLDRFFVAAALTKMANILTS